MIKPYYQDDTLDEQIKSLEAQKEKLKRLSELQREVGSMERMIGASVEASEVVKIVCGRFRVQERLVRSLCRDGETAIARQAACYVLREITNHSLTFIGNAIGRDHGTVLHACRAIRNRMDTDAAFRSEMLLLTELCRAEINKLKRV